MIKAAAALGALLLALMVAGCGEGDTPARAPEPAIGTPSAESTPSPVEPRPTAFAPSAPPPPDDAPLDRDGSPPPAEQQPGGAGDEAGMLVRETLRLTESGVEPAELNLPAFLPAEITLVNVTGSARRVSFDLPEPVTTQVPAGGRVAATLPGQRPGRYAITSDGSGAGALVMSAEAAP